VIVKFYLTDLIENKHQFLAKNAKSAKKRDPSLRSGWQESLLLPLFLCGLCVLCEKFLFPIRP